MADFIRAVGARFTAFHTNEGTVGAAPTADTYHLHTVIAKAAFAAEIFLSHTVYTIVTVCTELIPCAVFAFFITFRTDCFHTLGTTVSTDTNIF